jgi:hypothetical protein
LFVFLLDQSGSMEDPIGGNNNAGRRKMDELATAINSWLQNMSIRATGSEGVKHWMDVALIGYRTDQQANPIIASPLLGALGEKAKPENENRLVFPISEIAENPGDKVNRMKEFFDDESGELMKVPEEALVWVAPKAEGGTPMCTALHRVYEVVEQWIAVPGHEQSFPPIVIHITDGECSEGDPLPYAEPIMELETQDGQVLLFNCHLSMSQADPIFFPPNDETLPDNYAKLLFKMSSPFPEKLFQAGVAQGFNLQPGARGMAFNADMVTLIKFLDMGTRQVLR